MNNILKNKKFPIAVVAIAVMVMLAACDDQGGSGEAAADKAGENVVDEQDALMTGFNRLRDTQQIPTFDWSQELQTLIDVLSIRAEGTTGTAYARVQGSNELDWWCPTVGAPVPSTYQISSSTQYVDLPGDETQTRVPVDMGEPTGIYVGDSNATWVLCLDDNGKIFAMYDEAFVKWTSGTVNGLPEEKRAKVDDITFEFTEAPE